MKLLDRHISQAVLLAMIVVLGVIVALDVIFSLVDELGEAGVNYHAGNAVMFVLFGLSSFGGDIFFVLKVFTFTSFSFFRG